MSDSLLLLRRLRERGRAGGPSVPPPGPVPGVGGEGVSAEGPPVSRRRRRQADGAGAGGEGVGVCRRRRRHHHHHRHRRRFYPEHRVYRARSSFLDLSEEEVMRRYRLDKAAIAGLCRELGSDLESLTGRSHALPVAVKVTSALAFLASGSFQTASRAATGISQSAMSNCLAQFLEALQRRAGRYIAFPPPPLHPPPPPPPPPSSPAGSTRIPLPGAFPGVLGLVGGMHVALRAPSENEALYRNAGNYHSMNMQVVCDREGAITNVVAKFPGSCPNAAVLENSALARLLEGARPHGAWLLGDHTYPLKPWLMTPIARPRGGAEELYNALHGRALAPLPRTLGLLRRRFRCLDPPRGGALQYSPPKVCQIFLACCILHNLALRRRTLLAPPGEEEEEEEEEEGEEGDEEGGGGGGGGGGAHRFLGPPPPAPPPALGCSEGRAVRARIVQQVREGMG